MHWMVLWASCALWLLAAGEGSAQTLEIESIRAGKRVAAVRIGEPIVIDGVLDEPAWSLAEPAAGFHQQTPDEFAPATERTEVRFLYDGEMLYVGAMLYDSDAGALIVNELARDFQGFQNDIFVLVLDTFLDRRNAYGFMTNAGSAQRDVLAWENGRRNDANWNGVWFTRSRVHAEGWTVEMAVPFKTLRFPAGEAQEWGLNMLRLVRRKNEFSTWSPVPRQFSHYSVAYAGTLTGIAGVRSGNDLRVTPFATGQLQSTGGAPAWDGSGDGGVDVKWGITSSLLLDASYRTDFSQVEADEQQINLTRFNIFFPERRQFFLENPASFQVGLTSLEQRRDLVPFFSRRIGLLPTGQPVPVIGGLRLTGRAGGHGVGLLTMQTDGFDGTPGANFAVARVTRDVSDAASLGAFYFGRETTDSASFNRVSGLDVRLAPRRTLEVEAFAMRSQTQGTPGGWAGRTGLNLDTSAHRARVGLVHVGDEFRHDLGFVRRRGVGTFFGNYERVLRPANPLGRLREHTLGVELDATMDDRYERSLTRTGSLTYGLQFNDGGQITARTTTTYERLETPFIVGSELQIEAGEHRFESVEVGYRSDQSARVSGNVGIETGEYWTGTQRIASGGIRLRINQHVAASASLTRNHIDLPGGVFDASLARFRLDWSFTPRVFVNAFVQYNGESDAWLSNVRFNLIHRPLSDIYVVWNETRQTGDVRRALLLKYTHLIAF